MSLAFNSPPIKTKRPRSGAAAWPRGPRKHPSPPKSKPVPFGLALAVAFPSAFDFQGRYEAALTTLNHRVTRWAVRNWCNGRRKAPPWARAAIVNELRQQIAARQHVLALLEADMEPKPDPLIGEVRNP